ncbi:uncharacterized protein [Nicotiana tomentosiformis]|uniref:uncharacterized protein n=1 Tax=Nicotiana tomentosiformis TaxID=4098 RepID=UPI00388C52DD
MPSYKALYGRRCHSPIGWFELGESRWWSTDLVRDAMKNVKVIQERLRTAQSRQKNYTDRKVRIVAYMVGEMVLLRVSPMKGVMLFEKKGNLSPRFIGPFKILERVGEVTYRLALPPRLAGVHQIFHVSMLRKYHKDSLHVLVFTTVHLDNNLTSEEESVAILDRQVRKLRSKSFSSVKVQWRGDPIEEATWESESDMRSRCWQGRFNVMDNGSRLMPRPKSLYKKRQKKKSSVPNWAPGANHSTKGRKREQKAIQFGQRRLL